MVIIEEGHIDEIPVLTVVQSDRKAEALKTIIFYHGFNGEKDSGLQIAYRLAHKGFRVVLPDSDLHGARAANASEAERALAFWEIVVKNIKELNIIKSYLVDAKLSIADRIGVVGISMGGITTFGALAAYDWIHSAVVLMGAPNMRKFATLMVEEYNKANQEKISDERLAETLALIKPYDLTLQPERLANRPLLIWHGDADKVVPTQFSQSFYKDRKEAYETPSHLKNVLEKGRSHHVSRLAIAETVAWFEKNI